MKIKTFVSILALALSFFSAGAYAQV